MLECEPSIVQGARTILTQPKNRLVAELRWLPGVSPARAKTVIADLTAVRTPSPKDLGGLPALARVNVITELVSAGRMTAWQALPELNAAYSQLDPARVLVILNEDRAVAGVVPVPDEDAVREGLRQRLEEVAGTIATALEGEDGAQALARILEAEAVGDERELPEFLRTVTERYSLSAERYLQSRASRVRQALTTLGRVAGKEDLDEDELALAVKEVRNALRSWDRIAQPLQLLTRNTGQSHSHSVELFEEIRALALRLNNDHGRPAEALALSELMADVFDEVPKAAETVQDDVSQLQDILKQRDARALLSVVREPAERVVAAVEALRAIIESEQATADRLVSALLDLKGQLAAWTEDTADIGHDGEEALEEVSKGLIRLVRGLAVDLANDRQQFAIAKTLTEYLKQHFGHIDEAAENIEEDLATLERLIGQEAERLRAQRLDVSIGQDRLVMGPDEVWYRGQRVRTVAVDRVRWGIYKHYINGIRVNRSFAIWLGTPHSSIEIECVRAFERETVVRERYGQILDHVWTLVGARLVREMLAGLAKGETRAFPGLTVRRDGVGLMKRRWFRSEPYFAVWEELRYSSVGGNLVISSGKESSATCSLSYRDVDNVHILEALLDYLWKDGNHARLTRGEFA